MKLLLGTPFRSHHSGSAASILPYSLASSSVTPTLCTSSFTAFLNLLCGISIFLVPGSLVFNIICQMYSLSSFSICPEHLNVASLTCLCFITWHLGLQAVHDGRHHYTLTAALQSQMTVNLNLQPLHPALFFTSLMHVQKVFSLLV